MPHPRAKLILWLLLLGLNVPGVSFSMPPIVGPPVLPPDSLTVTVTATVPDLYLGEGKKGVFTVRRSGSAEDGAPALTVSYHVGGTATGGAQYQTLAGFIVLPAGQTEARVKVRPTGNGAAADVTVKLILDPGADYAVGEAGQAKLKIHAGVR